jgi:hypothetical protein
MEEHGRNFEELPPELIEEEPEYEVEQVLASRHHGCHQQLQYLLQWKGYSQAHDSWEPADQIHALELIRQFHKTNPLATCSITDMYDTKGLLDSDTSSQGAGSLSDTDLIACDTAVEHS